MRHFEHLVDVPCCGTEDQITYVRVLVPDEQMYALLC